jgi:Fe2+ or Zn2+ uptake regulation protein
MNERNTRQKYIILKVIKENKNHPTIAEICKLVQRIDPSVGQATVYRNVKKFVEEKKIYQIKTKTGVDRYDYYANHVHFECLKCGKLLDIMDEELLMELSEKFKYRPETIENYNLMLEGYCEDCKRGSNEKEVSM